DVVHQPAGIGAERPPKGADHSGRDRAFETVRIANGDGELADADVLRFTQARGGEVGRVDAEDGEVGVRILANQLSVGPAAIAEDHFDSVGAVNDVAVGQNKSVRADDEARTASARLSSVSGCVGLLSHVDFDDGWTDPFRRAYGRLRVRVEQLRVGRWF